MLLKGATWKIANALGYQLVWVACVVGAAHHCLAGSLVATAVFAAMVLGLGGQWRADLRLLPAVLLCGLLLDSAWIALGWMEYSTPWPSQAWSPPWILCIWIAFALTLNHSLAFLRHRYALAALLGAVAGPLAYWGASRGLGAVRFESPAAFVLIALALAWAAVLPLLVWLAELRSVPAPAATP